MASKIPFICGVRVQRGAFLGGHDIALFKSDSAQRASIIFGHNGSENRLLHVKLRALEKLMAQGIFTIQIVKR